MRLGDKRKRKKKKRSGHRTKKDIIHNAKLSCEWDNNAFALVEKYYQRNHKRKELAVYIMMDITNKIQLRL